MRWTHRTSPYGPIWLLMSLLPASLGLGKFILNFLMFKVFIGSFHIINTLLVSKILYRTNPKAAVLGTALYALNPALLLEGVANSHNDLVLATFILLSIYFFVVHKNRLSVASIAIGFLIKYLTIFLIPIFIFKKTKFERLILLILSIIVIFTFVYSTFGVKVPFVSNGSTQIQFQPWYLFWTLPPAAILPNFFIIVLTLSLSVGSMARYLPYLYWGDWSQPNTILFMQLSIVVSLVFGISIILYNHFSKSKL